MLCFNYDSYFRFVVFSRVSYLNKYVVFKYVSLLKITFHLNIVLVVFVLNIVLANLYYFIFIVLFYFPFSWAQPGLMQAGPSQAQFLTPKAGPFCSRATGPFPYARPSTRESKLVGQPSLACLVCIAPAWLPFLHQHGDT